MRSPSERRFPPRSTSCAAFFGKLPEHGAALTLAESINRALGELLAADESVLVFGEDVGAKGGVYGVTRGLQKSAGADRVFDTLLDEQTILGIALGAGVSGLLPIPEIQYLAYVHNAIDQIRGEGATLSFFSNGQYTNRWSCASPATATRRGLAATSTTTTRSAACAISPAWSSPRRRTAPMRRRCCERVPRRRSVTEP